MGKTKSEEEKIVEYGRFVIATIFLYLLKDIYMFTQSGFETLSFINLIIDIAIIIFMNIKRVKILIILFFFFVVNLIIKVMIFINILANHSRRSLDSGFILLFIFDFGCYLFCLSFIVLIIKKLTKNKD